jgi:hypothetical protein
LTDKERRGEINVKKLTFALALALLVPGFALAGGVSDIPTSVPVAGPLALLLIGGAAAFLLKRKK